MKIINFEQEQDGSYSWQGILPDDAPTTKRVYYTNSDRQGLFSEIIASSMDYSFRQLRGTSQFHLPADPTAALAQLEQEFQ